MKIDASNIKKKNIVVWGAQQFFTESINSVRNIQIKYVYPGGPYDSSLPVFEKYVILDSAEKIEQIENVFVLIARGLWSDVSNISRELEKRKIPYDYLGNYTSDNIRINFLQAMHADEYVDINNNHIVIHSGGKGVGMVNFSRMSTSSDNYLEIGKVNFKRLSMVSMIGKGGRCIIEDGSTIEQVEICVNSGGSVRIGKDCLFSYNIVLMQTDHHHIFDLSTHERINVNKDIMVGNHVWVGRDVHLMAGAEIGDNNVLGAGAVTSSKFKENNMIIAGSPAKVIRRNIIWAEDAIRKGSLDNYDQAQDKRGLEYL